LLQKRLHGEIEVDATGVTGYASVEAASRRNSGTLARRASGPKGDIERRQREHGRSAAAAVMQGPPDVMPDGFSVIRFAPSISSGISRRSVSAIAPPLRPTV